MCRHRRLTAAHVVVMLIFTPIRQQPLQPQARTARTDHAVRAAHDGGGDRSDVRVGWINGWSQSDCPVATWPPQDGTTTSRVAPTRRTRRRLVCLQVGYAQVTTSSMILPAQPAAAVGQCVPRNTRTIHRSRSTSAFRTDRVRETSSNCRGTRRGSPQTPDSIGACASSEPRAGRSAGPGQWVRPAPTRRRCHPRRAGLP